MLIDGDRRFAKSDPIEDATVLACSTAVVKSCVLSTGDDFVENQAMLAKRPDGKLGNEGTYVAAGRAEALLGRTGVITSASSGNSSEPRFRLCARRAHRASSSRSQAALPGPSLLPIKQSAPASRAAVAELSRQVLARGPATSTNEIPVRAI